jgi:hypothetical protein
MQMLAPAPQPLPQQQHAQPLQSNTGAQPQQQPAAQQQPAQQTDPQNQEGGEEPKKVPSCGNLIRVLAAFCFHHLHGLPQCSTVYELSWFVSLHGLLAVQPESAAYAS